jgi:hypothetical protein
MYRCQKEKEIYECAPVARSIFNTNENTQNKLLAILREYKAQFTF